MKTKEYWTSGKLSSKTLEEDRQWNEYELGYYNTLANGGFIINVLIKNIEIFNGTKQTHREWFWIETDEDLNVVKDAEYSALRHADQFKDLEAYLKKKRLLFVTTPSKRRCDVE